MPSRRREDRRGALRRSDDAPAARLHYVFLAVLFVVCVALLWVLN